MAPTIPPEIWLRTAQFIPSSILKVLYLVNLVFLHLALLHDAIAKLISLYPGLRRRPSTSTTLTSSKDER